MRIAAPIQRLQLPFPISVTLPVFFASVDPSLPKIIYIAPSLPEVVYVGPPRLNIKEVSPGGAALSLSMSSLSNHLKLLLVFTLSILYSLIRRLMSCLFSILFSFYLIVKSAGFLSLEKVIVASSQSYEDCDIQIQKDV
jgi:hypothetical protein